MNKEIELLNKKIEAQDKIINTQALEIAELREENEKLTNLWLESQNKRRNAIEYIQKRFEINEYGEYYFTHTFDNSNMKELLEILEENNNEE